MAANLEIHGLFGRIAGPHAFGHHLGACQGSAGLPGRFHRLFAQLRLDDGELAALEKSGRWSAAAGRRQSPGATDQSEEMKN
jgi:hypothetical protein